MTPETDTSKITSGFRIGILCNPLGGRVQVRLEEIRRLGRGLGGDGYREASTPVEIGDAISNLLEADLDLLCLIGGDGTVQAALTALHSCAPPEDWPLLAALPGGTTNMTAKDLGSWRRVEAGLKALASRQRGSGGSEAGMDGGSAPGRGGPEATAEFLGTLVRRPVLRIEGAEVGVLGGMFLGVGAAPIGVRYFHERHDRADRPGNPAFGSTIGRVLWSLAIDRGGGESLAQPLTCSLDGDQGSHHQGLLCLVTTLDRLLLGLCPYWGREPEPMHFTLVEKGARRLWWRLHRLARGWPGRALTPEAGYHSRNARCVELVFDGPFVVDGEFFEARAAAGPIRITAVPGVKWLTP